MKKTISYLLILCFLAGLFSSCRILKGDPRKNCNHPDHGSYMRELQLKRMNKKG